MKTSTERPRGAGGGSGRRCAFHMVMPYSTDSPRLYVSASTSGTAIHQASQATVEVQRQATYEPPNATTSRARQRTANNLVLLMTPPPPMVPKIDLSSRQPGIQAREFKPASPGPYRQPRLT